MEKILKAVLILLSFFFLGVTIYLSIPVVESERKGYFFGIMTLLWINSLYHQIIKFKILIRK